MLYHFLVTGLREVLCLTSIEHHQMSLVDLPLDDRQRVPFGVSHHLLNSLILDFFLHL